MTAELPSQSERMRNTRLPKGVSTYLAAQLYIEERELRGLPTPRNPVTSAPSTPPPLSVEEIETFERRPSSRVFRSSSSESDVDGG
jgi:hypothetical protein